MSYYDIDAILTDAEKIPCEFQLDVPYLGYLDNNPSHALKAGAKLNLPLWLAEMLALANAPTSTPQHDPDDPSTGTRSFATLNLPPALSDEVIQALKADPRAVPLRDQSAHFYGLAARMLDLFEERELAAVLRRTFVVRAAEVGLHARKAGGGGGGSGASGPSGGSSAGTGRGKEDGAAITSGGGGSNLGVGGAGEEFLRGLDEWERKLFRKAHDGTKTAREYLDNVKRN